MIRVHFASAKRWQNAEAKPKASPIGGVPGSNQGGVVSSQARPRKERRSLIRLDLGYFTSRPTFIVYTKTG